MQSDNAFSRIYQCPMLYSESLDVESSFFGTQERIHNLQVKFVCQGHRDKVKVAGAKKREISSHHPSVTDMAQSRCNCSDAKSTPVIQGIMLPACQPR